MSDKHRMLEIHTAMATDGKQLLPQHRREDANQRKGPGLPQSSCRSSADPARGIAATEQACPAVSIVAHVPDKRRRDLKQHAEKRPRRTDACGRAAGR